MSSETDDEGPLSVDLGTYSRQIVTNIPRTSDGSDSSNARTYFDLGLRYFFAYMHENAYKMFLTVLTLAPDCALAHGLVALCHSPNYNFKGEAYYESTDHPEEELAVVNEPGANVQDTAATRGHYPYPSQQVAAQHAQMAMDRVDVLKRAQRKRRSTASAADEEIDEEDNMPQPISDVEVELLSAICILTCQPGIDPKEAEKAVGRPYADALREIHERYPHDAEVCSFFAESLMVLNAWNLYEYPTGKPISKDVAEIQSVLEKALEIHPEHAGLCHLYVHLCEMSNEPHRALTACTALRSKFPDAGHLVHMATHIDVLVGDYESCVRYNLAALRADKSIMRASPDTAGPESFYFGYIVHNYHMLVFGAILGGFEKIARDCAAELNEHLNEELFISNPDLAAYLESYAALDIHILVRFGRWDEILRLPLPRHPLLMLFRTASLRFARGLALANLMRIKEAEEEADEFSKLRANPSSKLRILHNNNVYRLLEVDDPMLRGEIAYHSNRIDDAFELLRTAVTLQDELNFDEPWGKMQPVRHALGGLLFEQGKVDEAESVFREDLRFHPGNPWAAVGLIRCLGARLETSCCGGATAVETSRPRAAIQHEIDSLRSQVSEQRRATWADFEISLPCLCCEKVTNKRLEVSKLT
mmetsp:Transcript_21889/g.49571  ORF Transcript_21889/g.49571 Transcript_21889/m.49571 type:complete len:647 (-) Transcript_21889:30-1970(-)